MLHYKKTGFTLLSALMFSSSAILAAETPSSDPAPFPAPSTSTVQEEPSKEKGIFEIEDVGISLRYRLALIDQENLPLNSVGSTLQTLVHVKTGTTQGFSAFVSFRDVSVLGDETFNDTINGKRRRPVVADPANTEVDQAYLQYAGLKNTTISAGRKRLVWGNKRFVSDLVWRQSPVTFDGVNIDSDFTNKVNFKYTYAFNINRAFSDRSPVGNAGGNFHLANLSYDTDFGKLTAYGYFLDSDDAFFSGNNSNTLGFNFTGSRTIGHKQKFGYVIEAANQSKLDSNPTPNTDVSYLRIEPSVTLNKFKVRAGYELLGGNGQAGFQTPVALLHAYNGWADQFLVTPVNGLQDFYGEVTYAAPKDSILGGAKFLVAYHHFESDTGGITYGDEWNAQITKRLFDRVNFLAKIAHYKADQFRSDVTKIWFQLATKF